MCMSVEIFLLKAYKDLCETQVHATGLKLSKILKVLNDWSLHVIN